MRTLKRFSLHLLLVLTIAGAPGCTGGGHAYLPDVLEPPSELTVSVEVPSGVFTGDVEVSATVVATNQVLGVEFYVDAFRIDTDLIPPYNTIIRSADYEDGTHVVSVFTSDYAGNVAEDGIPIEFENGGAELSDTIPADGATVFFEDGPLYVELKEPAGGPNLAAVTIRVNGLPVGEFVEPPFVAEVPYEELFITEEDLPKNVFIQFKAEDQFGIETERSVDATVTRRLAWKFETLGDIWATAGRTQEGDLVFGNMSNKFYCLSPEGTQLWSAPVEAEITSEAAVDLSTGTSYFGAMDGRVHAVSGSGAKEWTVGLGSPPGGAIRFVEGTVYVAAYSGDVYALSANDGSTLWQSKLPDFISASPTIGPDGTLYVGCQDASLYAVASGEVQWSVPTGDEVWSTPAVGDGNNIFFGSSDGWLYAVDQGGSKLWMQEIKGQIWGRPLTTADGFVYVGSTSKYVTKLVQATGNVEWTVKTQGITYSSPAKGPDGIIYLGTTTGKLYALEPEQGEIQWTFEVGDTIHATPLIRGNKLYFGSTDRYFYAIWLSTPDI